MPIERDSVGFDAPAPLGHPARAGIPEGAPTGPELVTLLPEFALPNSNGMSICFHRDRAGRKVGLVFYRSAAWSPLDGRS